MIVRAKGGYDVDVSGDVWTLYKGAKQFIIDWTPTKDLPTHVVDAAKRYATRMVRTGAASCVRDFVNGSIKPLLECPSAQLPALTEAAFDELRALIPHDKASINRFRKFYRCSVRLRGFDRDSSEVMDSVKIGAHRTASADQGRNPPLPSAQYEFLRRQLALHRAALPLDGRVALGYSLALGPNADPMSLARGADLSNSHEGPKFGVAQHKKGHSKPRSELRGLPIDNHLACDMRLLAARNAELASAMVWPDGSIGLPDGVAVPLFMRSGPKPSHAAANCPERQYALHMTANEVSVLLRETVVALCRLVGADPIHMTARTGKRTVMTEAQRHGLPAEVIALIGGHQSTRHIGHYAAEGILVLDQVQRALGDRLVGLGESYVPVAPALEDSPDGIALKFRKVRLGANDD
ncbi:hypothetical protein QA649_37465 [Bradyrhizobium sp. CB1717]|uniref:hypothetical protein n=1 Tax=Bradyrhizobium sp. CB1717 TaxID=3039154 RepID=UPI0024B27D85|nr:hypothetical protein [Bradyrhizobium sp. CB1717]WFU23642.1 hypothetical protein QA649_37465 [Bradyrhizobium sp. CB1717]